MNMKNRCLTIFFVVMTLAISPQVWQKLGNLLDAIQHRAQIKMLSLVLSPQDGEVEVEPASSTIQSEHFASCQGASLAQAPAESQTKPAAAFHKIKTEQRATDRSEKQEFLAFEIQSQEAQGETLPHHNNPARETKNLWAMHGATFVQTNAALNKSNIAEAVMLPRLDSVAPVFVENVNFQFKLRKILDENKLTRQKTRCPLGKSAPTLPSS
jgi:hypothetical protein